jgi:predicted ester cyclase
MAVSEYLQELASRYTAEGSLTVNEEPPAVGRSAVAAVAEGFMRAFPDMQVHMDGLSADDDRMVYRWTLTGTNSGPAGTGMPVKISGYEEWRISADGLIAESLGHFDAEEYQRQLACSKT